MPEYPGSFPAVSTTPSGLASYQHLPAPAGSIFASPKSRTFTLLSTPTLMLAGFKSRCTTPFSCAASSAFQRRSASDRERLRNRDRTSGNAVRQSRSLDVLHYQEIRSNVVQRANVGMIQGRNGARFPLAPAGKLRGDDLERNRPAEPYVHGPVDDAHAAGSQVVDAQPPSHRSQVQRGRTRAQVTLRRPVILGPHSLNLRAQPGDALARPALPIGRAIARRLS